MDSEYQKLLDETKEYVRLRYKLLKLDLLEKSSRIIALLIVILVAIVLAIGALTYFSLAIIHALEDLLGGLTLGYCIFGGLFVLLALIMFIFKDKLIINPLIKQLSEILFKDSDLE